MDSQKTGGITILETELIVRDNWLGLMRRHFLDRLGKHGSWTYVERNGDRKAVVIVARHEPSESLILIRQFRVPMNAWVFEFPAGLMDEGETPYQTATREMEEETGYSGTILRISSDLTSTAGLCSEIIYFVEMSCTTDPAEHAREASEAIEVVLLRDSASEIEHFLAVARAESVLIDGKLQTWLSARLPWKR